MRLDQQLKFCPTWSQRPLCDRFRPEAIEMMRLAELYNATLCGVARADHPPHGPRRVRDRPRRLCLHRKRITISTVLAGRRLEVDDSIRRVSFMHDDLGYVMIWDTSTWSRKPCNPSTTRSARGCHPCLRYVLLPMCPGWTSRWNAADRIRPAENCIDFGANSLATLRQPDRHVVVTHVSGTFCYLCVRAGHGHTGGESGIRTHGTVSRTHAFQACALSHSAISPEGLS